MLALKRQSRKDVWEEGEVLALGKEGQMLLNAAAIGECQGLKFVQELDFERLKGEIEDVGEQEWPTPVRKGGAGADVRSGAEKGTDQNTGLSEGQLDNAGD